MAGNVNQISMCEVCGNDQLESVLDLGSHPMCDDLVPVGEDRRCKEYPIEILFCSRCVTGHQRFQIPKDELFPPSYHYRSRHTADVLNGMRQLATGCVETLGTLEGIKVLDIGCNDGSLLTILKEAGAGATFGIEPTDAAEDAKQRGHTVFKNFLTEDVARQFVDQFGQPDLITFTNVFAHIEDLPAVIRSLQILMHDETAIVIENHYLGSVIDRKQFDTFYHEHPRTYSYTSFAFIADALGRRINSAVFPARYGGNIRVTMTRAVEGTGHDRLEEIQAREHSFGADLKTMAREIDTWKANKGAELASEIRRTGKLVAKAFPGRSAIPVKMLNLDESMISAVYEKPASGKIGHYVPGTRIPILSDDDLAWETANGPVLNMAWHIASEIKGYLTERGYQGELIDIISPKAFQDPA